MSQRSYAQYCGLARALDLLGERWTLLVIRELLLGPQRFSDLVDRLPGIGPNLLSTRLKSLEAAGVVERRRLPRPAASTVYELTEFGRELEPAVTSLTGWGLNLLGERRPNDTYDPRWLVSGLRTAFRPDRAGDLRVTAELRVEDQVLHARIAGGAIEVGDGPAADPDAVISADANTLLDISASRIEAADAIADGRVTVEGDAEAALRFADALRLPPPRD